MPAQYNLRVQVEINQVNEHGAYTGDRLSVGEEFKLPARSFIQIAKILGRFHDLAEQIKAGTDHE